LARNPPPAAISHVRKKPEEHRRQEYTVEKQASSNGSTPSSTANTLLASFSAGLPPLPNMLVKRMQEGEFISMSELAVE